MGGKARVRCGAHLHMNQLCGILVATATDGLFRGFCPNQECKAVVALTRQQVRSRGSRGFIVCSALVTVKTKNPLRMDSDRSDGSKRRKTCKS
jgi:hypothetical protein